MTSHSLWLPGDWPTTNRALDMARADGHYQGYRRGARLAGTRGPAYSYAELAAARKEDATYHGMALRRVWSPVGQVGVWFWLLASSPRPDAPDSWGIAGKWALDGLVASRLLADDRRAVRWAGGRSVKSQAEGRELFLRLGRPWSGWRPGLLVELVELAEGAPEHLPPWHREGAPCALG
jgi:hypothetical protein